MHVLRRRLRCGPIVAQHAGRFPLPVATFVYNWAIPIAATEVDEAIVHFRLRISPGRFSGATYSRLYYRRNHRPRGKSAHRERANREAELTADVTQRW